MKSTITTSLFAFFLHFHSFLKPTSEPGMPTARYGLFGKRIPHSQTGTRCMLNLLRSLRPTMPLLSGDRTKPTLSVSVFKTCGANAIMVWTLDLTTTITGSAEFPPLSKLQWTMWPLQKAISAATSLYLLFSTIASTRMHMTLVLV